MAIPAITAAQAVQLGAAAIALGPAVSRTFGELLKSAGDLFSPSPAPQNAEKPGVSGTGDNDLDVLTRQIAELLARFNKRLSNLLQGNAAGGADKPPEVMLNNDGSLQLPPDADAAKVKTLVANDDVLATLLRQIIARKQLLTAAGNDCSG